MAHQRYEHGPTTCAPTRTVVKSIRSEIKAARALSRGDIRLATTMGLVASDANRPLGLNDGLFYPPGEAVMRSAPNLVAPSRMVSLTPRPTPATRTMHALALLVDFSDNPGSRPKADFESMLFDQTNPSSLTSYYAELSGGALSVTGEATDWIRAPHPYSYYTAGQSGMGNAFPANTPGLLVDALKAFCLGDSLARFDTDGDGYVDGIFLIHAGGGAEAEADPALRANMIWSHKWTLPKVFSNKGVKVYAYSTEPEDGKVGVFTHEFGHVLGLPDLYDETYRSEGIGSWCLMASGSWGGGGASPARLSAWCLAKLGWITPTVVSGAKTLTLDTLANDPAACVRAWTGGRSGPEYFLLENRQKVGRDKSLPGSGLAVWHVDERQSGNTNPLAYLVGLVQADGKRDLEYNRNAGDTGDLFPGAGHVKSLTDSTTPSSRANDGTPSKVALSAITMAKRKISLRLKV